nr:HAD-IC family P-type ATPase [Hoeflea alexandrii]
MSGRNTPIGRGAGPGVQTSHRPGARGRSTGAWRKTAIPRKSGGNTGRRHYRHNRRAKSRGRGAGFIGARLGLPLNRKTVADTGEVMVVLAVDGEAAGHVVMADTLRTGTTDMLAGLRSRGIERILLATGDRRAVAEAITEGLGLDAVRADLTPDQKVLLVLSERKNGPVMMVGDGVNDAPALAAADIGVAMGARGAAASAEAADVVLLVDHLDRLLSGLEVAQRAQRIAFESVAVGISLSVAGMIAAAFGYLTPVEGALLQEVIDVAVILNALRALRIQPAWTGRTVSQQTPSVAV